MAILGLNYTKISAERTGNSPHTEINTVPRVTEVKESKIEGLGSALEVLAMDFIFESIFKPKVGHLSLEGVMLYKPKDNKHKEDILKLWKKDKQLPADIQVEVINHLFRKVSLEALNLADLMQLPPVINLPKLRIETVGKEE